MWTNATPLVNRPDPSGNAQVVVLYTGDAGEKEEVPVPAKAPYTTAQLTELRQMAIQEIAARNARVGKILPANFTIDVSPIVINPTPLQVWRGLVAKAQYVQGLEASAVVPAGTAAAATDAALKAFDVSFIA